MIIFESKEEKRPNINSNNDQFMIHNTITITIIQQGTLPTYLAT